MSRGEPIFNRLLQTCLEGSDSAGTGAQSNPWRTIQKAASYLQTNGVTGPTTVHVTPGAPSFGVFTENVTIGAIAGTSSVNTVTIQPLAGKFVRVDNTVANSPAFKLSGCTFVTVKGFEISTPAGAHGVLLSGASTQSCTVDGVNVHDVTGAAKEGIRIETGAASNTIRRCVVSGKAVGIHIDTSNGNTVINNFVYGGSDQGIWVDKSASTKTDFNSVRSFPAGAPSQLIRFSPNTAATGCEFKDNNCYLDTGGPGDACFYVSSTAAPWTGNHQNLFVVGSGRVGFWNGNAYATLSAWKAAGHGQDANSISADPREISAKNQRLCQGVSLGPNPLVGAGVAIAGITTDIDGITRGTPPTIGAHELPLGPFAGVAGIVSPTPAVGKTWLSVLDALAEATARGVSAPTTITVETGAYTGEHRVKPIPGAAPPDPMDPPNTVRFIEAPGNAAVLDGANADNALVFDSAAHVAFEGFEIANPKKEGALFTGTSKDCSVVSSWIRNVGVGATTNVAGVRLDAQTTGCKVNKCRIEGKTYGVHVSGATDAEISNSWILGSTLYGAWIQNANGTGFHFNSLRSTTDGTPNQLLRIDGGSGTKANSIRNNVLEQDSTGTNRFCIYVVAPNDPFDTNANCYFTPNNCPIGFWNGQSFSTIETWKAAGHGEEERSFEENPEFIDATDLHLGDRSHLAGRAFGIPGIEDDIDGDLRGYIPTVGADEAEFDPVTGTVSVKPDGSGDFASLRELFAVLAASGISSPVTALVDGGLYIEEGTVLVRPIPGASVVQPVVVKASGVGGAPTVENLASEDIFTFDGPSHVSLEGFEIVGGSAGHGVVLKNASTRNTLKALKIHSLQGTNRRGVQILGASADNTVTACDVLGATYAVEVDDSDGTLLSNNFLRGGSTQALLVNNSNRTRVYSNVFRSAASSTPPTLLTLSPQDADTQNEVRNNTFYLDSSAGTDTCIHVANTVASFQGDTNDYFVKTAGRVGKFGATAYATLSAWKAAGHGQDQNSVSGDPKLVSATDPHIQAGSAGYSRGTALAAVPVDIDGQARSAFAPDIGVDEFFPVPANQPPVASTAGSATTGTPGSSVSLVGTASSDPDSQPLPLRYSWVQVAGPTVTINTPASSTASFTPPKIGTYVIRLTVDDGKASSQASATVTVRQETPGMPIPTLVVGPLGPFFTIQSAVDVALPGQVIGVQDKSGGYKEEVVLAKNLSIQRFTGHNPILEGEGTRGVAFTVNGADVTLDGFEIRNYRDAGVLGTGSTAGSIFRNLRIHDIAGGATPSAFQGVGGQVLDSDVGGAVPVAFRDTDADFQVKGSHVHDLSVAAFALPDSTVVETSLVESAPTVAAPAASTTFRISSSTIRNVAGAAFEPANQSTLTVNQGTLFDSVAVGIRGPLGAGESAAISVDSVTARNTSVAFLDRASGASVSLSELRGGAVGVFGGTGLNLHRVLLTGFTAAAIQEAAGTFNRLTVTKNLVGFDRTSGALKNSIVWDNTFAARGTGASALSVRYALLQPVTYDSFTDNPNVRNDSNVRALDPKFKDPAAGDFSLFLDPQTPANSSPAINHADPLEPVPAGGGSRADLGYTEHDQEGTPDPFEETPIDNSLPGVITCELVDSAGNPLPKDSQGRSVVAVNRGGLGNEIYASRTRVFVKITVTGFHDKGLRVITANRYGEKTNLQQNWVSGFIEYKDPGDGEFKSTIVFNGAHQDQVLQTEFRGIQPTEPSTDLVVGIIEHERNNQFRAKCPVLLVECNVRENGKLKDSPEAVTASNDSAPPPCEICLRPPVEGIPIELSANLDSPKPEDGPKGPGSETDLGVKVTTDPKAKDYVPIRDFIASADHPLRTDAQGCVKIFLSAGAYQGRVEVFPLLKGSACDPCTVHLTHRTCPTGVCPTAAGASEDGALPPGGSGEARSVDLFDGDKVVAAPSFVIPGRQGLDFALTPIYRSRSSNLRPHRSGDFANDWTISYLDDRLIADRNHIVRISPDFHEGDVYRELSDVGLPGEFRAPQEYFTRIQKFQNGDLRIRDQSGRFCTYRAFSDPSIPGRLIRCQDRFGNFMSFLYDPIDPDGVPSSGDEKHVLTTVVDSMGRNIRFLYFAATAQNAGDGVPATVVDAASEKQGRLARVVDFRRESGIGDDPRTNATPGGREYRFDYHVASSPEGNAGDLASVTAPAVGGTPTGNDFPQGRTTRYAYRKITDAQIAADHRLARLRSNLLSVAAPNEVAANPSAPTPRVVMVYGENPADETTFDRPSAYTLGGTNASGVPAGGTINYVWTKLNPSAEGSIETLVNRAHLRVSVKDRNGNDTDYEHSAFGTLLLSREKTRGLRSQEPPSFDTVHVYQKDKLLAKTTLPLGNTMDIVYDDGNPDRHQQGNLLRGIRIPDPARGGDQAKIVSLTCCPDEKAHEPISNLPRLNIDPRGTDPDFVPPIPDPANRAREDRYSTLHFFDFQEDTATQVVQGQSFFSSAVRLTEKRGLDPAKAADVQSTLDLLAKSSVKLGLGDLNGDGKLTSQAAGNIVRTIYPSVVLLPNLNQTALEALLDAGDAVDESKAPADGGPGEGTNPAISARLQTIARLRRFNNFGQPTSEVDAEGNVHTWEYFPENDPDGDGIATGSGPDAPPGPRDGRPLVSLGTDFTNPASGGGYLRRSTRDASADPEKSPSTALLAIRDNNTNPAGTDIRETFTLDDVGHTIGRSSPRGICTDFFVNELGEVVEAKLAADVSGAASASPPEPLFGHPTDGLVAFGYLQRSYFDANGNRVLGQTEDRGNTSSVDGNLPGSDLSPFAPDPDPVGGPAFVDAAVRFDILDEPVETAQEVTQGAIPLVLRTRTRYDRNENAVMTIHPAGNADAQVFDERDLSFQTIRGAATRPAAGLFAAGDPTTFDRPGWAGTVPSVFTRNFDANRNPIESVDAADTDGDGSNNSTIAGAGDATKTRFDGFDRPVETTDPMGNKVLTVYDPASNGIRTILNGDPVDDLPGSSENKTLAVAETVFDERNGALASHQVLFQTPDVVTVRPQVLADTPAMDGLAAYLPDAPSDTAAVPGAVGITVIGRITSLPERDRQGRGTFSIQDDLDAARSDYDGAGRSVKGTDSHLATGFDGTKFNPGAIAGNTVETAYDDEGTGIETLETDVSLIPGLPTETFRTTRFTDSLGRDQTTVDNLGHAIDRRYDSRGDGVATADAQGPVTTRTLPRRGLGSAASVAVNDFGNVSRSRFDGASRHLESETVLTASGQGDGIHVGATLEGIQARTGGDVNYTDVPARDPAQSGDGLISVYHAWDDDSQGLAIRDDNGSTSGQIYDNQGRSRKDRKGMNIGFQGTSFTIAGGDSGAFSVPLRGGVGPVETEPASPDNGTTIARIFDPDSNVPQVTDEAGNVLTSSFDALNRRKLVQIARAPGFIGTTEQRWKYDGLTREHECTDDNGEEPDVVATHAFDSTSRGLEESQKIGSLPARVVSCEYDIPAGGAVFQESACVYPDGRRTTVTHDRLDRLVSKRDAGALSDIGRYEYIGKWRVGVLTYQNGTRLTHIGQVGGQNADVGFDALRRIVNHRWEKFTAGTPLGAGTLVVGFGHQLGSGAAGYDRMDNKLLEEKLHDPDSSEVFVMDSTGRLADPGASYRGIAGAFKRGTLNAAKTDIATLTARPGERQREDWTLDGTGNWVVHTFQDQGAAPVTDDRRHSDFNEIFDRKIASNPNPLAHDPNGNTTDTGKATIASSQFPGGGLRLAFDAPGRLREVWKNNDTPSDPSDDILVSRALYATDNRRVRKIVSNSGDLDGTTDYYYHGWRVMEEREGSDAPTQQYAYGNYLDEPWTLDNRRGGISLAALNDGAGAERHQYHCNTLYSLFGLTDEAQALKEAYLYQPYGAHFLVADGVDLDAEVNFDGGDLRTPRGRSAVWNVYTFTGQRLDLESRALTSDSPLLYYKRRHYHPDLARFLSRDPLLYEGQIMNPYQYALNSPLRLSDPYGLDWEDVGAWVGSQGVYAFERLFAAQSAPLGIATTGRGLAARGARAFCPATAPAPIPPGNVCGPDVTLELKQVLGKLRAHYYGWSEYRRRLACAGYIGYADRDPNPPSELQKKGGALTAANSWDIPQLGGPWEENDWIQYAAEHGCAVPAGPCGRTVRVLGTCHKMEEVNYVLFGAMSRLCDRPRATMTGLVRIWRSAHLESPAGAVAWANAGYDYWHGVGSYTPPSTVPCATTCALRYADIKRNAPFQFYWYAGGTCCKN